MRAICVSNFGKDLSSMDAKFYKNLTYIEAFTKIVERDYQLRHVCLAVRPAVCLRGSTQFPLEGFS
jgi:hypothetical protein